MLIKGFLISVLLCVFGYSSYAQQDEYTPEQWEMIYKMAYGMNSELFKKSEFVYKKVDLDLNQKLPTVKNTTDEVAMAVDSLIQNAEIKIEKGHFSYNLIFESRFPANFDEEHWNQVVDFNLKKQTLTDRHNSKVEVVENGNTSIGFEYSFEMTPDGGENINYRTLNHQNNIEHDTTTLNSIKGEAIYEISFSTEVDTVRISKKDIGYTFVLQGEQYQIVDFIDNKLILNPEDNNAAIKDLNYINLSEDGQQELVGYSMYELSELKEKDKAYENAETFLTSSITMYKPMYEIFEQNKDISEEEFKKLLPIDKLKAMKSEEKYLVLVSPAPFENDVLLFAPIYGYTREIIMKLK